MRWFLSTLAGIANRSSRPCCWTPTRSAQGRACSSRTDSRGWRVSRRAAGKTPFVAAVETTDDGKPRQIILRRVKAFSTFASRELAGAALASGAKAAKTPRFKWVNTALGNIKTALVGTYRAVREQHAPRYLAEFEYRFNRRYDLGAMIPRLAFVAATTAPMPYRLLKLADDFQA
jgi:hypothetical protein